MQLVLIIDNDPHTLKRVEQYLRGTRIRLVPTANNKQGLEYAKSANPDLIIVNISTDRTTLENLVTIKNDRITRDIPILGIYGSQENEDFMKQTLKLGITEFLIKPITKEKILPVIQDLLNRSKIINEHKLKERRSHIFVEHSGTSRTMVIFTSGLKKYVLPEIRNVFHEGFLRSISQDEFAIDLRNLPDLKEEEVKVLELIVSLFSNKKITLIAGRHLGIILSSSELEEKVHLFMSLEEYEGFLEKPPPDTTRPSILIKDNKPFSNISITMG
ncbi:MAG: response regulator [Leptospiraceae bacterium]|nr:response regulator [Leptospiraceae bacterium]MCP5498036.1 response regulator [Leptospiraceae bacterium]